MARNIASIQRDIRAELISEYNAAITNATMQAYQQLGKTSIAQYAMQQAQVGQFARVSLETQLYRNTEAQIHYAVSLSGQQIIAGAEKYASEASKETIGQIGRVYKQAFQQRWRQIRDINTSIANEAILATIHRYDDVHRSRARGSSASGYRAGFTSKNKRYAAGALRSALGSPLMAQATLDGVTYLNTSLLDTTAKQWARLNFGAGPNAGNGVAPDVAPTRRQSYKTKFFQEALGNNPISTGNRVNLDQYKPRGGWIIPAGVWLNDSNPVKPSSARQGLDMYVLFNSGFKTDASLSKTKNREAFIEAGRQRRTLSKGVAAWGFLEAGINSLAQNFPAAQAAWLDQIFQEAQSEVGRGIPGKLNVDMNEINAAVAGLSRQINASYSNAYSTLYRFRTNLVGSVVGRSVLGGGYW